MDKAENEPEKCRAVNVAAVEHLVRACGELDCPLVQIGTDYVLASAPPRRGRGTRTIRHLRKGCYARTKLEGERAASRHPKHLIVRTCGL